jgi:hypothetical protein
MMPRGYDCGLYILPFGHRGSFQKRMCGWNSPLNEAQTAAIAVGETARRYHEFVGVFENAARRTAIRAQA